MNATLLCIEGLITEVVEELSAPTGWHLLDIDVVEKATEGTELPARLGAICSISSSIPGNLKSTTNREVDGIDAWQHMGRTNARSNTR